MNARNGFENFFSVTKIELVLFVTRKLTAKRMEDRKNHGLVYYEKPYGKLTFGDKIITPQAGQIVYFPQGSSYDVSTEGAAETDGCHAINFLAPDLPAQEPFVFCPKAPQQIFPYFLRAEKAWKEKRPGYEEQCLSCLYAVIASLKSSSSYAPSGYENCFSPPWNTFMKIIRKRSCTARSLPRCAVFPKRISVGFLRELTALPPWNTQTR